MQNTISPSIGAVIGDGSEDINPGVYTQAYVNRIRDLSKSLAIRIYKPESQDSFASLENINMIQERRDVLQLQQSKVPSDHSGETGLKEAGLHYSDKKLPDMARLCHLHKKYFSTNDVNGSKTIEDLQRDLFCVGEDFGKLEVYL